MSKNPLFNTSVVQEEDEVAFDDSNDEEKYLRLTKKSFSSAHPKLCTFSIVSAVLTFAGLITFGICAALASTLQCKNILNGQYDTPLSYNAASMKASDKNRTLNVILFGDSLINHPYSNNNLAGKMAAYLPDIALNIQNYGVDGDQIESMAARVGDMLANTNETYAVILYWDSDVSDNGEYRMTTNEISDLRSKYRKNLIYVIDEIRKAKPEAYLAISGPEILGEGPLFTLTTPYTYYGKIRMLRRYTEINKQIVANYPSVPYIDMRQAFLNAIPRTYYGYTGCLTIDGEHENENGSIIVAKMFSDQLLSWLLMGAA